MLNGYLVPVLRSARATSLGTSAAGITLPVRLDDRGPGSERTATGKRAILHVQRLRDGSNGALDGTIALWGANLPNPVTGKGVLGNAFAQAPVATSVRPQGTTLPTDGTKVAFTTEIDLAAADLAAAIVAGSILVELPSFKLTGTFTVTAAGAITGSSSALDTETKVGDQITINGVTGTILTVSSSTAATWDATIACPALSTGINISKDRRFKTVLASGASGPEQVDATVANDKLVLTFPVAPPATGALPVGTVVAPGGATPTSPAAAYLVTPTQVLADGANEVQRTGIKAPTVMWALTTASAGGDLSSTTVLVEHAAE